MKNFTLFIAEVDGDGVAITSDFRLTKDQVIKVHEFIEQLQGEEETNPQSVVKSEV